MPHPQKVLASVVKSTLPLPGSPCFQDPELVATLFIDLLHDVQETTLHKTCNMDKMGCFKGHVSIRGAKEQGAHLTSTDAAYQGHKPH
jgi:hypothetical protein